jgi:hypothetical protein
MSRADIGRVIADQHAVARQFERTLRGILHNALQQNARSSAGGPGVTPPWSRRHGAAHRCGTFGCGVK